MLDLPGGDTLNISSEVVAFYRAQGYRQAWTNYDEIEEGGWTMLLTYPRRPTCVVATGESWQMLQLAGQPA